MIESGPFYFIPLIIIIILNSCIMHSLRKTDRVLKERGQRNATRHKRNKRIMIDDVNFYHCYILLRLDPFLRFLCLLRARYEICHQIIFDIIYVGCRFILPVLSTCLNHIIIFSFCTNYREALRNCLRVFFVKCQQWFNTDRIEGPEVNVELPEIQGR